LGDPLAGFLNKRIDHGLAKLLQKFKHHPDLVFKTEAVYFLVFVHQDAPEQGQQRIDH
jgi:hypothetical protein